jgi:hypothetical protein
MFQRQRHRLGLCGGDGGGGIAQLGQMVFDHHGNEKRVFDNQGVHDAKYHAAPIASSKDQCVGYEAI